MPTEVITVRILLTVERCYYMMVTKHCQILGMYVFWKSCSYVIALWKNPLNFASFAVRFLFLFQISEPLRFLFSVCLLCTELTIYMIYLWCTLKISFYKISSSPQRDNDTHKKQWIHETEPLQKYIITHVYMNYRWALTN